ncbi:hypothetical protein GN958_ATG03152 [Phytophthora infestans]|uniref:Uncharacterized protein n=1 Tax=Phytophthora infestans TaxID=4787 RepID=A0A8S9V6M7_PHYIN|nr:hypothetical protein GN958_ATG03152 [Phytophthora infestans]
MSDLHTANSFPPRVGTLTLRSTPSTVALRHLQDIEHMVDNTVQSIRHASVSAALNRVGASWPALYSNPGNGPVDPYRLNKPLQASPSVFIHRTRIPSKQLTEPIRCQIPNDYTPHKGLLPDLLRAYWPDFDRIGDLIRIAIKGIRVQLATPLPRPITFPCNRPSASV